MDDSIVSDIVSRDGRIEVKTNVEDTQLSAKSAKEINAAKLF